MNKVGLSGQGDQGKPGRIIVRDPSPASNEVLDAALQIVIAHQGKTPSTVIGPLSKNLRRTLYDRLAGAGVIRAEQGRTLGLFPTHRWPAQDTGHEEQVRELVAQALVRQGHRMRKAPRSSPSCTRSGASTRSSTPATTACPSDSSGRVLRRSPRATGRLKPSARRSRRSSPRWPPPAPPRPHPPAPASITGITTPERDSRTICLRARAKLALPGSGS